MQRFFFVDTLLLLISQHKGKKVAEVLKKEPQYYDWIMKSDFAMDTKKKLTAIRLKSFNK